MALPSVWIVLPSYNGERFLPDSLASLEAQTYPNWSVYLVDDGSSDRCPEIARAFARRHRDRVELELRPKNSGLRRTINRFYRSGAGYDYLAFFAQDDLWDRDHLERQVEALESSPEAGFVFGEGRLIDAAGEPTGGRFSDLTGLPPRPGELARQILFEGNSVCGPSVVARSALVSELALRIPIQVKACTDYFTWLVLSSHAPVLHQPGPSVSYRLSSGQFHRRRVRTQREDFRIPRLAWKAYACVRRRISRSELLELERRKAWMYFSERCEAADLADALRYGGWLLVHEPGWRTLRRVVANLWRARRPCEVGSS